MSQVFKHRPVGTQMRYIFIYNFPRIKNFHQKNKKPAANNLEMFRFKKFTIHQDKTAMKVCTDACIMGGYVPTQKATHVLDIGTGTGLLALMIAQRCLPTTQIDAVELDIDAFHQATQNVRSSIFTTQIDVYNAAIQRFNNDALYDLVVSNPPFFQNHLKSSQKNRNQALHTDTLSFDDLLEAVSRLLSLNGTLAILLPAYEMSVFEEKAKAFNLFVKQRLIVRNTFGKPIFRVISIFERTICNQILEEELIIRDSTNEYTPAFIELLKDYYLIF
jgi:tRNA1Val (adenine37-N6)-methyltransferase